MTDTSAASRDRYFELLRQSTPVTRLAQALRLTNAVRSLAQASIRAEWPMANSREVNARLAKRLYGPAVASRLFPDLGADVG